METVVWTNVEYKQAALPSLVINEEIARRDSITSSKTHDSGYTSDPDWDSVPPCRILLPPQVPKLQLSSAASDKPPLPCSIGSALPPTFANSPLSEGIHQPTCSKKAGFLSARIHGSAFLRKVVDSQKAVMVSNLVQVTSHPSNRASDPSSPPPSRSFFPSSPDLRVDGYPNKNDTWSCDYPGCTERAVFTRGLDLKKHYDKHNKLPSKGGEDPGNLGWKNPFGSLESDKIEPSNTATLECKPDISRNGDVKLWIDESASDPPPPKERVSSIVSLSSTGSGGDYSITDDSEDEEAIDSRSSLLSKVTRTTIELIMRKIEVNFGYVAYVQSAGGQSSRGQANTGESSRGGRRGSAQHGASGKRKTRSDDDSPPEDPDEDGTNKRRRVSLSATEDSEAGPRFACPFYKHDPNRYRNRRTCPGPGWPTVHRMKEHLYRSHAQPIFCPRCYATFDSDNDYAAHARTTPCQVSVPQPIEGIDRETLKSIRKRSPAMRLEEDKWRDTYHVLFPDVQEADIPSPYYDSDSPSEESRRFRRELLSRIRNELFVTAERETGPVQQDLLRQVAGIIQRCEGDLLRSFHADIGIAQPAVYGNEQPPAAIPDSSSHPIAPIDRSSAQAPSQRIPAPKPPSTSIPSSTPTEQERRSPSLQMSIQHQPTSVPDDNMTHFTQSPTQFFMQPWEDFPFTPSSEWIDWNAVFPPAPELAATEPWEPFPKFSVPVRT
ncbi:uncharacterized protein BDR25DRAFT_95944 [Lindgomyces ingoldianus]|uniref:Uncharacterized protein n=1 Tax=Lindgomyces ingoldianus TaxID=673940 RepID=A0ACB6QCE3_9PLEO|nr:uncharacterized protein BDR25DRAFT_95944 [Lindgomyces ingoldianus]KAF2464638.1 hypothetical protein BDR25DRAFT_95944 [Lindgomyces ingoldianus]